VNRVYHVVSAKKRQLELAERVEQKVLLARLLRKMKKRRLRVVKMYKRSLRRRRRDPFQNLRHTICTKSHLFCNTWNKNE
jgi:hypothetical protein